MYVNMKGKFRKCTGQRFSFDLPEERLPVVVSISPLEENKQAELLPLFPLGLNFLRLERIVCHGGHGKVLTWMYYS